MPLYSAATNAVSYQLMFEVENLLRELIRVKLQEAFGPRWVKTNVPGDVRTCMQDGIKYERGITWTKSDLYPEIYYTEFTHIQKIIARDDNWKAVFQPMFGAKDRILSKLSELAPIRNKIAHARLVTPREHETIRIFRDELAQLVEGSIESYLMHAFKDYGKVSGRISDAVSLLAQCAECIENLNEAQMAEDLENIFASAWWFDDDYLCSNLEPVRLALRLLQEYNLLPRGRGTAYIIEGWITEHDARRKVDEALAVLKSAVRASKL